MKPFNTARIALLLATLMLVGLTGCEREGPAERAGKQLDKATESMGNSLEKAGRNIEDAARRN